MTPARLERIEEIFCAALDQEPDEVAQFLDSACEGDELLRRKVESLLTSYQRSGNFIETSAAGVATKIIENGQADLLVGQTFGHYKISKRIGSGGMGEVYLATDVTAGRKAALKLLPMRFTGDAERLKRFQQEAHAVVALNHPNILTVYEIGEDHSTHYIASELIEGETLRQRLMRGRMEVGEAVDVAIQVASALAAAHEAGIVHRDIKPENIMLRPDGYVKVLDFGIAKLAEEELPATMPRDEALLLVETNLGSILGTVRYMSPEQACGAHVDKTTDIWSLGVVLYEMLTGHAPFTGDTPQDVMFSILEKEPPPLTRGIAHAPAELQQIISKALRKDRSQRYHSAHELLQALKDLRRKLEAEFERAAAPLWLRWARSPAALVLVLTIAALALALPFYWHRNLTTSSPPEKSIAVLPFENRSEDKTNAYFAEGVQDEILTRLSKIADLKVISRTSTQHYKSAPENLPEIARQLGVAHILEGSVQKSGDALRVNVQLIKASNDSHLWADTFDRKLTDIFSVESEVAKAIADQLQAKLSGQEEQLIAAKPTENPEAYDAYLRGLAYTLKTDNTAANTLGAQKYLREAVGLDPKFALAWALLSYVDALGYLTTTLQPTVALREEAQQAAETALTLQPNLGEAILAKGYYHYACLKDYDTAVRYFEQARQLLPNSSRIPEQLAYVTRRRGQWDKSEAYFNEAERLDPRDIHLLTQHALSYMCLRRFPEALRKLDQVLNITPDDADTLATKAAIAQAEGDLPRAAALLAPLHPNADDSGVLETQVYQAILEHRSAQIILRLKEILAKPDPALGYRNGELRFWLGWAQEVAGDHAAAQESWRQARSELESFLKEEPENFTLISDLALTNMGLGDKAAALALSERAMAALPIEKDALVGPDPIEILARVAAQMGEPDRAIAALLKLLSIPYAGPLPQQVPLTPALLRLDPMFDPLRNDLRFQELAAETAPLPDKSIAVLPFENRSEDKANAYFAGGIQDEILTRLSKIADLKVISRTSTQHYKSAPENLPEIARQLGVAHILEGSVQKSGDAVRVNVQLIKAANDSHLWADTFDRKLTDIFSVESEVAKAIADQLRAKLTGQEEQAISAKPTDNVEAYDAYLRGLAFEGRSSLAYGAYSPDLVGQAAGFFERAVQLDPNFALAWARLSHVNAHLYFSGGLQSTSAQRDTAKRALDNAQKLEPNSPETLLALGYYQYYVLGDYGLAKSTFRLVSKMLPSSSEVPYALGRVSRREGNWDESIAYFEQALTLEPRNVELLMELAETYGLVRQFAAALKLYDRVLDIKPNDLIVMAEKASIYQAQGNLQEAATFLSEINEQTPDELTFDTKISQLRLERNYGEAVRLLQARLAQFHFDSQDEKAVHQVALAFTQRLAGDTAGAKATAEQSRDILERLCRDQSRSPKACAHYAADLSQAYAAMGKKDSALKTAAHAIMLWPRAKDPKVGPAFEENLVLIETSFGANSRAISTLARLLETPYGAFLYNGRPVTPALLRLDPVWDPLRSDPAFQKLCEDKQP
jgi:eukaryotic-like serine/threonine-protein kinase